MDRSLFVPQQEVVCKRFMKNGWEFLHLLTFVIHGARLLHFRKKCIPSKTSGSMGSSVKPWSAFPSHLAYQYICGVGLKTDAYRVGLVCLFLSSPLLATDRAQKDHFWKMLLWAGWNVCLSLFTWHYQPPLRRWFMQQVTGWGVVRRWQSRGERALCEFEHRAWRQRKPINSYI